MFSLCTMVAVFVCSYCLCWNNPTYSQRMILCRVYYFKSKVHVHYKLGLGCIQESDRLSMFKISMWTLSCANMANLAMSATAAGGFKSKSSIINPPKTSRGFKVATTAWVWWLQEGRISPICLDRKCS